MFAMPSSGPEAASQVQEILEAERLRQWEKLILIPSESICHPKVAPMLASPFVSVYAEGQPAPPLMHDARQAVSDRKRFASWQTRLADGRYYRGCVNANRIELTAHRFVAEVFSALEGSPDPDDIYVCVQALSGAPANTAVYEALLDHGDAVLGLDLSHGGHLTHGSEFNYSGKTFRVRSYGVDAETQRLDYSQIRELAREHQPKLIIAGASSYPWDFDWAELRRIADDVGAYLLADIAHLAGMVAAGLLNNPLPHAHVVTLTTHKTLCGPRGAVILTIYPDLAKELSAGVFPGLQGGPHIHTMAAIARLFEIIHAEREDFVKLQQAILDNTAYLATCLQNEGFELAYGGTNTHMLLIDLKRFADHPNPEIPIDGEIASRLLEIAGLVCNKNVLPGDETGAVASGIRLGMPWATQRGISRQQIREIASIIKSILGQVRTFRVWVPAGDECCRGKIAPGVLESAAGRMREITQALPYPARPEVSEEPAARKRVQDRAAWLLRGDKVRLALGQMLSCSLADLQENEAAGGLMLRHDGTVIDDVIVVNLGRAGREERFALLAHEPRRTEVETWVRELSDGYLLFMEDDLYAKIDGPTVIEPLPDKLAERLPTSLPEPSVDVTKPYFIGQGVKYAEAEAPAKNRYEYTEPDLPLHQTLLNETHKELGGKMAGFANWEMPIQYPGGILAEHRAVRTAAGLFDVSHMSQFEVKGKHALAFLDTVLANCVSRLDPGEAQYTYMLYPDGTAMDDLYVYRLAPDRFMLVANAANAERDWDWINAVNSRQFVIDPSMPAKQVEGQVEIRDLREDGVVGLALQGPVSAKLLCRLTRKTAETYTIERLEPNKFVTAGIAGIPCIVARTGYTGELVGFELYVHPSRCVELWSILLDEGEKLGAAPAGLGARDSTRTEAGFPLFGHELEGPRRLSITEAGYGFVTRFHVPFFVGRDAYIERMRQNRRKIIRLRGKGRRSVRSGHAIIDSSDATVGQITSFAYTKPDFTFFALGCVSADLDVQPGDRVRAIRQPAERYQPSGGTAAVVELEVVTRFPEQEECESWPEFYA